MTKFTMQNAIDVQNKNLEFWKDVLKEDVFELVKKRLDEMNETLKPKDRISNVLRGSCLDTFVLEYVKSIRNKVNKRR